MTFSQCLLDKGQPSPWNRGEGEPRKMIDPRDICPRSIVGIQKDLESRHFWDVHPLCSEPV